MKKLIRLFVFTQLLFGVLPFAFSQKLENTLLWEISGKGLAKPSYLFGTYHLLNDAYLTQEQSKVLTAFKKSEAVVVETILDTAAIMNSQIHMVMFDKKLSNLLDTAVYRALQTELLATMGVDITQMELIKPIAITTMLSVNYAQTGIPEVSKYDGTPLDQYFVEEAIRQGKRVNPLESMEEQMQILFEHYTIEQQTKQLSDMVLDKKRVLEMQKSITASYMSQNLQKMYDITAEEVQKEMSFMGGMEFITTDRNKRWMEQLPKLMQSGSQFIAVGALHLPGPDGLIDLLRKQGYTLKPIL